MTEWKAAEQATTGDIGFATYTAGAPAFLAMRCGRLAVYRNSMVVGGEAHAP